MSAGVSTAAIARVAPVRLRGSRTGSLRIALIVLAVCAGLLGMLQLGVATSTPDTFTAVLLFTLVFWIWAAAGVLAWWRRPNNVIGALIVIGALAVLLGGLGNLQIAVLAPVGAIFATSMIAVTLHLLHAFPSGRLHGKLSITTVIAGYVVAIALQAAAYGLAAAGLPGPAGVAGIVQRLLALIVVVTTAVVLASRLVTADPGHRRVLLPLFLYGILAVLLIFLVPNVLRPLGVGPEVTGVIQLALTAGIPIAFLLGVLRGGFTRTGDLEALSAWLGVGGATRPAVARALASTLGDDSMQVLYWSAERSTYIDESGGEVGQAGDGGPDRADPNRGRLEVRVGERLVGAISYDSRLIGDPYPVRRAAEILAIAVDRERLTAELLASNEALSQSRLRLVETADRERSRIAADLHDGLQVQLVLLALEAQKIAHSPGATEPTRLASAELRRGIDQAAADLRRLVHNVLPAALVEHGLAAALEDLVDRLDMPATLDAELRGRALSAATTHTAYFIVAEVLTNAVKHSRATAVSVRLRAGDDTLEIDIADDGVGGASAEDGTGLRGLIDRVDVLGGAIAIDSPAGRGTRVRVELPCE